MELNELGKRIRGARKLFLFSLAFVTIAKLILSALIPITGDEAYFLVWAQHLDYGYFEHPPMIAWVIWLMSFLGKNIFIYRLFAVFSTVVIASLVAWVLAPKDREKAYLAATLFMLSPMSVLGVLITNDVPLILFVFTACALFYRGILSGQRPWFILAGICAGLAFLSKYFAVLAMFGLLAFAASMKNRRIYSGVVITMLCALPFAFLNLYWNYTHCWTNLMFNLFYRNRDVTFRLDTFFVFLIEQIFLLMPWVIFYLIRRQKAVVRENSGIFSIFCYMWVVPFVLLAFMSFFRRVGLHWSLAFCPFFFVCCIALFPADFVRLIRYSAVFSIVLVIFAGSAPFFARRAGQWCVPEKYSKLAMFVKPEIFCDIIRRNSAGRVLASDGYTEACVLGYHCKHYIALFASPSRSGRQDDIITDYRELDGRNFLIFSFDPDIIKKVGPYFETARQTIANQDGVTFYLVFGDRFIYSRYRSEHLSKILRAFYGIPPFLPIKGGYFYEKYFPETISSRKGRFNISAVSF